MLTPSHGAVVAEETDSGKLELKALDAKLHGWDVNPDDIQICARGDGSEWVLGAGTFGAVRRTPRFASCDARGTRGVGWVGVSAHRTLATRNCSIVAASVCMQVYKALRDGVQDVAVKKLKVDATENGVQSFLEVRAVS